MKIGRYLVGLASGLTFGVLFAPKKGKQLRQEMSKNKGDIAALGKAFKNAGEDALEEIKKLSQNEQVAAFLEMSKEKMDHFIKNMDEGNSETLKNAKLRFEEISSFALEKATFIKNKLNEMEAKSKKTVSTVKKRAAKKVKEVKTLKKTTLKKASNKLKKVL